ncbi:hypothetical protein [Pseudomonas sp. 3A(2025)]
MDDDQLVLNTEGLDDAEINDFLIQHGCQNPQSLERIGNQIYLYTSRAWTDRYIPFFADAEALWHTIRTREIKPDHHYVIGMDTEGIAALNLRLGTYFSLRSMLKSLCHHEGDESQPMKYVFFRSKESFLTKLEVRYAMSYSELISVPADESWAKRAKTLELAVGEEDDVHCDERRHVMRETLIESLKEEENRNIQFLMSSLGSFYQSYTERYKVYISKFSVNKILAGIESERIGFLCKVQDAIMTQQTKAFAIPGGVIAVGAFLKSAANGWDFFIIFIGLLISTWMIASLNSNVIGHIDLLSEEFEQSVSKYDDVVVGIDEIEAEIKRSRVKLLTSSSAAKIKLQALTRISWLIFILVSLVLFERADFI